jgi:hypothetical protein
MAKHAGRAIWEEEEDRPAGPEAATAKIGSEADPQIKC